SSVSAQAPATYLNQRFMPADMRRKGHKCQAYAARAGITSRRLWSRCCGRADQQRLTPLAPPRQNLLRTVMRRAFILGSLAALLPACSWLESLFGESSSKRGGPVEPVPHEELAEVLPKMEGWQASPPSGKRENVGENHVTVVSSHY